MPDQLLETNGTVSVFTTQQRDEAIELSGETNTSEFDSRMRDAQLLIILFPSIGDGRGFSLAAELREGLSFGGKLYAAGQLNPDQLSLAFQCGFDGLIVDEAQWNRYGERSWIQAMDPVINRSYLRTHWNRLDPIWEDRVTAPSS